VIDDFNGGNLYDRIIYNGFLQETPTATLGAYLISLIIYLKKNGVILRNLRPEHMFFEDKDSLDFKLVDLSLAMRVENYEENAKDEAFDEFTRKHPIFIAPELFKPKKKYDFSCDVWSIACVIYNCVTGVPPFYEEDRADLKQAIFNGHWKGTFPEFEKSASEEL
jgi:serine/threonine protein kinase